MVLYLPVGWRQAESNRLFPEGNSQKPVGASSCAVLRPGHGLTRTAVFACCQLVIEVLREIIEWQERGVCVPWSSIPDSNRRYLLGRQVCYHYTNAAYCRRLTARRLPSFRLSDKCTTTCSRWWHMTESNRPPGKGCAPRSDPVVPYCRSVPAVMRH